MTKITPSDRSWTSARYRVGLLTIVVLALVPLLTHWFDRPFYLDLATRLVILAIAATSLNFILGYGGMISFGHAAYIGIGAYCVGIPVYHEVYSGWSHLIWAAACSAAFALITGAICLRTRGVYFIMITMAFSQMVFFALVSLEDYGGDDGLVIELRSEFIRWIDLEHNTTLYYVCWSLLVASIYAVKRLTESRFGRVIQGSRSNAERMRSLGFHPYRYQLAAYVIAGTLCGLAGALLGNFTNFISPEMMDWTRSGELIFIVVLGGAGTLFGPVFGATAFILLEEFLSALTLHWHLPFGLLLIAIVIFARGGISGLLGDRRR